MFSNDKIFNKIVEALLVDYSSVYYVNAITNEYQWYSVDPKFHSLHIEQGGEDFFKNMIRDAEMVVHEDDRHIFTYELQKDKLISAMKKGTMKSYEYRLLINGKPVYHSLRLIRGLSDNEDYFILGIINIEKEVDLRNNAEKFKREREIYNKISESLASHYDTIYYINAENDNYREFVFDKKSGAVQIKSVGTDFFTDMQKTVRNMIYPTDRKALFSALNKISLIDELKVKKQFSLDYRLIINSEPKYTRLVAMWASDKTHFIIGVENIDEELRKEHEQANALKLANQMARHDELTGIKNKNAFFELERTVQSNIENGLDYLPFGIIVCDINDLKAVNDNYGHKAGDEYIKASCKLICSIFAHSPVFRVGGDEFVVFLRSSDYENRDALITEFHNQVVQNLKCGEGPVVASGMAVYDQINDKEFTEVFERADTMMYENKKSLKDGTFKKHSLGPDSLEVPIPPERKKKLDSLFEAFSVVAEGTYVYIYVT